MKNICCIAVFSITTVLAAHAQNASDTTVRKNTIKLDITSYWLYRNAVVFSYERVIKNNSYQTWGVTMGYQEFPALSSLGSDITTTRKEASVGFKYGGEYRFYLQKENKYKAPHGVYLGPYLSVLHFKNKWDIDVKVNGVVEPVTLDTKFDIINIGVQLGYQFVLNNRWTIDLVFIGPSVSNYRYKAELEGNFTFDPEDIHNEIINGLIDRFPGFKDLITDKEVSGSGKINTWAYGYRYQFQLGYHFGRKKK